MASMLRLIGLWALGGWFAAQTFTHALELQAVGEFVVPNDTKYQETRIGGLSGIVYDARKETYFIVSDTKDRDGSKVFLAKISFDESGIQAVDWTGMITLKDADKSPLPSLDAEGIALENKGRLFVSFEGTKQIPSGIAAFGAKSGNRLFELPLPPAFASGDKHGIQSNHGFESLCTAGPSRRWLFTMTESPLAQDATVALDSYHGLLRLLRYDVKSRDIAPPLQRAYAPEHDALYTSVPDVLALDEHRVLVLERQLLTPVIPRARRIRIYEVNFDQADATDVAAMKSLKNGPVVPLKKALLFDSDQAKFRDLDNIEALCLGPALGKDRSVILVSDDNFSKTQQTQFLLLRLKE